MRVKKTPRKSGEQKINLILLLMHYQYRHVAMVR